LLSNKLQNKNNALTELFIQFILTSLETAIFLSSPLLKLHKKILIHSTSWMPADIIDCNCYLKYCNFF